MLSINNLSFYFGSRALYEKANLHIKPKDRIGLIGANGTGKSTLLRLIVGEYQADSGDISKSNECTIGFLNQDLLSYQSSNSILKVAMEAFEEQNEIQEKIDEILKQLETNYSEDLVHDLSSLQERFETLGGYTIQSQAEEILEGLGFKTVDLSRPLKEFSGGWRMRVMLAKLHLQKPELLMLDEPTNHLDLPSIQWIENYINTYEGAIIIVSHDRQFLDNTANIIVEVTGGQLVYYQGNYSFFLEEKALRSELQKSAYENQQQKIKQTERFIERFRAKATKAKQVQSRVKELQRLDIIDDVVDANAQVNFKFNFGQQSGKQVLKLENIDKAFGDLVILNKAEAFIERGDKIALIGANGKGKSTLLRIIAGTENIKGKHELGHNVNFSFFAQHQLESLDVENTLIDELKQAGTGKTETELRGVLGCFLFSGDDVFKKIKILSGGEKSRVALAKVLISEANFLLLDEPTNHLDMLSVNILIQALQQYEGTFVVVSHDRHFVSNTANKIWYIENEEIKVYPGTYEEYEYWRLSNIAKEKEEKSEKKPEVKKKEKKAVITPENQEELKKIQKELKNQHKQLLTLEDEVTLLEEKVADFEVKLADPQIYEDKEKADKVQLAYNQAKSDLEKKQENWEMLALKIDEMEIKLKELNS